MSKKVENKVDTAEAEAEAFEIIELAIDDIELLTRAFNAISEVCQEMDEPCVLLEPEPSKLMIH